MVVMAQGPKAIDDAVAMLRQARREAQDSMQTRIRRRARARARSRRGRRRRRRPSSPSACAPTRSRSSPTRASPRRWPTRASRTNRMRSSRRPSRSTDPSAAREVWHRYLEGRAEGRRGRITRAPTKSAGASASKGQVEGARRSEDPLSSSVCCPSPAALVLARPALADTPPSVWDRARDPATADSYRVHLEVQRRLAQAPPRDLGFSGAQESQKDTVRAMLERLHAEKSPDVRLRFDLGLVYLLLGTSQAPTYYKRAAEVLGVRARARARPSGRRGRPGHGSRRRAGTSAITSASGARTARCSGSRPRRPTAATSTLNLAETEMHLGNLKEAIEGYREALRIAVAFAVAHARAARDVGPRGRARSLGRPHRRRQGGARRRSSCRRSSGLNGLLRSSGVFFYPDYELELVRRRRRGRAGAEARRDAGGGRAPLEGRGGRLRGYVRAATQSGRQGSLARSREGPPTRRRRLEREKAEKQRGKRRAAAAARRRGDAALTKPARAGRRAARRRSATRATRP